MCHNMLLICFIEVISGLVINFLRNLWKMENQKSKCTWCTVVPPLHHPPTAKQRKKIYLRSFAAHFFSFAAHFFFADASTNVPLLFHVFY